jgi:hypothetical protein
MKEIPLTKGMVAIVDDADYRELAEYKWYVVGQPGNEYAARYGGTKPSGSTIHARMHRVLMQAPDGIEVDHINRNRLDNRRANLRLATRAQNGQNRGKFSPRTHSRYKGVTWHSRNRYWQAMICVNGNRIYLGGYKSEREAALAYNNAAVKYHGKFANLNILEGE